MSRAVAMISAAVCLLAPPPAAAQLDETCTVSALNRSAPVDASGVWVLPNVPSNLGPLRVRSTCVSSGVTRSGEFEFLQVPPQGIVQVPEILFDQPPRIPASLELASPVTTITEAGAQVQLTVTGLYPDGETADLASADAGTDYRVSNPAVATVDGEGMLTSHASGAVWVSAVNEGALAVRRLEVITSADSDGDGLPDDWEVANGLDPNDPVDALSSVDWYGQLTSGDAGNTPRVHSAPTTIQINPHFLQSRLDSPSSAVCWQAKTQFLANVLLHEARHAYQNLMIVVDLQSRVPTTFRMLQTTMMTKIFSSM